MTPNIYAKIQNGVVVNTQMCLSTDYMDPAYTWVAIAALYCTDGLTAVQIGCTYDGTNFTAPSN